MALILPMVRGYGVWRRLDSDTMWANAAWNAAGEGPLAQLVRDAGRMESEKIMLKRIAVTAAVAGLGIAIAAGTGCQKYQNYPVVPTSQGMAEDPSNPATEAAIIA